YGLINPKGILEGEQADEAIVWLSHPGITTRSVHDAAIVVNVLGAPRAGANTSKMRIGVARNFKADDEVTAAFRAGVERIRTLGHDVVPADAPAHMPRLGEVSRMEADRRAIGDGAFSEVVLLLLPTTTTRVCTADDARGKPQALSAENTMFANYFGLPAISVP